VVDYIGKWTARPELPAKRVLAWMSLPTSKEHLWKQHYGRPHAHNSHIPRDGWLQAWEKQAIIDFHRRFPLEGYRRLTSMMLDQDVVAVSPSSVYRVLKGAGLLDRNKWAPSKKGKGFVQPLKAHDLEPTGISTSPTSTSPAPSTSSAPCSTATAGRSFTGRSARR
jgi:putative transposase